MCGIGGIMRFGDKPITQDQIKMLLCSLESRGLDASGVALVNDGQADIYIVKDDVPGHQLAASKEIKEFFEAYLNDSSRIALVHCRAATQGSPHENENNHPLYNGGCAVIHNGIISNDDTLFREMKLKRCAATDSDILRAIVDQHSVTPKTIKQLSRISGSVAAAIVHRHQPGQLLLLKSGGPLIIAGNKSFLYFASEKHAIYRAARGWHKRFGIWMQEGKLNLDWAGMPVDSAWLIGPNGLEWHKEFKSASYYGGSYGPVWHGKGTYSTFDYHARQNKWQKNYGDNSKRPLLIGKSYRYMLCPNLSCRNEKGERTIINITGKEKELEKWVCDTCKTNLAVERVN